MSEFEIIKQKTLTSDNACSCKTCEAMCRRCPCLGTPDDILKLIEAGHKDKLAATLWAAGIPMGQGIIPMVQLQQQPNGHCILLTPDNRCPLHESGLKPTEGKLSGHAPDMAVPLPLAVAQTWLRQSNSETIIKIIESL